MPPVIVAKPPLLLGTMIVPVVHGAPFTVTEIGEPCWTSRITVLVWPTTLSGRERVANGAVQPWLLPNRQTFAVPPSGTLPPKPPSLPPPAAKVPAGLNTVSSRPSIGSAPGSVMEIERPEVENTLDGRPSDVMPV